MRNRMQCNCRSCGRMGHGPLPTAACPITPDIQKALTDFAQANGRTWKSRLLALWQAGADEGELRQARNLIGPHNLLKPTTRY